MCISNAILSFFTILKITYAPLLSSCNSYYVHLLQFLIFYLLFAEIREVKTVQLQKSFRNIVFFSSMKEIANKYPQNSGLLNI